MLDPLEKLKRRGFRVTLLPVEPSPSPRAGMVTPEQVAEAIGPETVLVSVMAANNEIGVLQPVAEIGRICRERGVLLHCDATQAVGKVPVEVDQLGVDLMSFTAHKLYGPKGIGALYVRRRSPPIVLEPLIYGGGHEARPAKRHAQRPRHRRLRPGHRAGDRGNAARDAPPSGACVTGSTRGSRPPCPT